MKRARELDLPLLLNPPIGDDRNGYSASPRMETSRTITVPPRPVRDPLQARIRDVRNPHRRRWRPES